MRELEGRSGRLGVGVVCQEAGKVGACTGGQGGKYRLEPLGSEEECLDLQSQGGVSGRPAW